MVIKGVDMRGKIYKIQMKENFLRTSVSQPSELPNQFGFELFLS